MVFFLYIVDVVIVVVSLNSVVWAVEWLARSSSQLSPEDFNFISSIVVSAAILAPATIQIGNELFLPSTNILKESSAVAAFTTPLLHFASDMFILSRPSGVCQDNQLILMYLIYRSYQSCVTAFNHYGIFGPKSNAVYMSLFCVCISLSIFLEARVFGEEGKYKQVLRSTTYLSLIVSFLLDVKLSLSFFWSANRRFDRSWNIKQFNGSLYAVCGLMRNLLLICLYMLFSMPDRNHFRKFFAVKNTADSLCSLFVCVACREGLLVKVPTFIVNTKYANIFTFLHTLLSFASFYCPLNNDLFY